MKAWGIMCVILLVAATPHAPLSLTSLDGAPIEVDLAPGERALVLHFWATWCPECIEELPVLDRIGARCAGSGARLLFVNVGEPPEDARRFAAEHAIRGAIVRDPKGTIWRRYTAAALPANLTWTAEGLHAEAGPRDEAAWARTLAALGCGDGGSSAPRPAEGR